MLKHQMEKLTAWWPDFTQDTSCHNSGNWPQRNGKKWTLELKIEWVSESHSVMSISLRPQGLYSPWDSPGQNTGVGSLIPSPGVLPNPGIKPRSPTLQEDFLPAGPQGKPKNTGAGSLSLLQWIFLTQESNWGLLHCRWILYQLSYQGSPNSVQGFLFFPHPCQHLLSVAFLMAKIDLFVFISTLVSSLEKRLFFRKS